MMLNAWSKLFSFLLDFLQSCKHESWVGVAKYLMDDVPLLLKLEDVKNVQEVLSVVFMSLPSNFEDFIKWIAEVRRREDVGQTLSTEEKARLAVKVCLLNIAKNLPSCYLCELQYHRPVNCA